MDIVESLYNQTNELNEYLLNSGEPSLKSTADSNLRKSILLASASFFEKEIVDSILIYVQKISSDNKKVVSFVKNKALTRQYHTLFNWNDKNCNSFLSLFGDDFKNGFKKLIENNKDLDDAVKAFLEIGAERNRLVHQDFGQYSLEKTSKEIFELHKKATYFLNQLKLSFENL